MSEYLSKEEIRQWRSSVEKITLEEFAKRLGKKIQEEKETNDLVDMIYKGQAVVQEYEVGEEEKGIKIYQKPEPLKLERINTRREAPQSIGTPPSVLKSQKMDSGKGLSEKKPIIQEAAAETSIVPKSMELSSPKSEIKTEIKTPAKASSGSDEKVELKLTYKKKLTDREYSVLEYMSKHKGRPIFAKELAELLDMKRDYIYKYIKNLRAKIVEDVLINSEEGGFILNI